MILENIILDGEGEEAAAPAEEATPEAAPEADAPAEEAAPAGDAA